MTTNGHFTSGPWVARFTEEAAAIAQVGHMPHATVFNRATPQVPLTDEDKANARLIAAAPALAGASQSTISRLADLPSYLRRNGATAALIAIVEEELSKHRDALVLLAL